MIRLVATHALGALACDGRVLPRPSRPWLVDLSVLKPFDFAPPGDIAEFEPRPDFARWALVDTPPRPEDALRWNEVEADGRRLLVCDRVILVRVSWDDLDAAGYVEGRDITIDGRRFSCRLLSGGEAFRAGEDGYAGGAPGNEWDDIVGGRAHVAGAPAPPARAASDALDAHALADPHNRLWNWFGAVSWTREPYRPDPRVRVCRGFHAAGYFYLNTRSHRHEDIGWRPVLEERPR
ncbi:MAG: hypothetical protein ACKOGH_16235 [Alphaproteobacteria bacterium]